MSMTIYRDNLPVILIDRHIGDDPIYGKGITGADFVRELNAIENMGFPKCEVWINSVGGSVMDGMDIYNAIAKSRIEISTRNVGVAASTAGWILQAGKNRVGNYYAQLMMHNSSGGSEGGRNALDESIMSMLASRCNKTSNWIKDRMEEEVWINAKDGQEKYGFYDEVDYSCGVEEVEIYSNGKRSPIAAYNQLRTVVNTLITKTKQKTQDMLKVKNYLNLSEDASEESVMKEITALKDNSEALAKSLKDTQDALKEKEDALKAISEAKEKAEKETAANEMVESYSNRIDSDDAKSGFKALAMIDFDGVKNTLEKMPVRKVANKLPLDKGDEGRAAWSYGDWENKDPQGLINMYKNSRDTYDLLLNKWLETKNTK